MSNCNCNIVIPSGILDCYNQGMDAFLSDPMCITATLVMPPRKIACPTCTRDALGKNSNFTFSGRPKPFSDLGNTCLCNGEGFLQEEVKEEICVRPYWNPQEWLSTSALNGEDRVNRNKVIVTNNSRVQIKTYLYNLPKLLNAIYLEFNNVPGLDEYRIYRFSLEGEPVPMGFMFNRYCISNWLRALGG